MTTLSLGRGSIFILALCLMVIIAFSFVLGMVSSMSMRGHEGTAVAAAECAPGEGSHALIAENGHGEGSHGEGGHGEAHATEASAHEDGEAHGVEGVEGAEHEGGEEGEGNIATRAGAQSRYLAERNARLAAEGPINHAFEMVAEHLSEFIHEYLPLPKDPRLDPMLFLNKELDEAKEEQDNKLQEMISGAKEGKEGEGHGAAGHGAAGHGAPASGGKPTEAKAEAPKAEAGKGEPAKADAKAEPAAPALPVAQLPPAAAPAGQTFYTIELGRFRSASNAQSFAEDVKNRGYAVNIEAQKDGFGQDWFYVRLGRYPDSMDAARHLETFERHEGISGVLVVLTPPLQSASAAPAN